jgi:hypothetical protein
MAWVPSVTGGRGRSPSTANPCPAAVQGTGPVLICSWRGYSRGEGPAPSGRAGQGKDADRATCSTCSPLLDRSRGRRRRRRDPRSCSRRWRWQRWWWRRLLTPRSRAAFDQPRKLACGASDRTSGSSVARPAASSAGRITHRRRSGTRIGPVPARSPGTGARRDRPVSPAARCRQVEIGSDRA